MSSGSLQSPPIRYKPVEVTGYINRIWSRWFLNLFTKLGGSTNFGSNYMTITKTISAPGYPGIIYIPMPSAMTLIKVTAVTNQSMSGLPEQVNILNAFNSTIATMTFPGSAPEGTVVTTAIAPNSGLGNDFSTGETMGLQPLGQSSSFCTGTFTLTFLY